MGWQDRAYYGGGGGNEMFGGNTGPGWRGWPVTIWLIVINVAIFFIESKAAFAVVGLLRH